ncbi:MAG: hypothetical protein ABSB19_15090 [Methylomonas sp.]|jgi:hypothetical protein
MQILYATIAWSDTEMFDYERVYSEKKVSTGEVSWYFQAREGDCGPYDTKEEAQSMLYEFVQECIRSGATGGRNPNAKPFLEVKINKRPKFIYSAGNVLALN